MLSQRLRKLVNGSTFRKNFFKVMQANAGSQLLLLASTPLLTRLFNPDAFGMAALFTSIVTILGAVCVWKADRLLPNCRSKRHARTLMLAGMSFLLAYCALVAALLFWHPPILDTWEGLDKLGAFAWFLPPALLLTGGQFLLNAWYVRESDMGPVSRTRWIYTTTYLLASIGFALSGFVLGGLIAGQTVGLLVSVFLLFLTTRKAFAQTPLPSPRRMRRVVQGALPLASMASLVALVNNLSRALAVLLIAELFTAAAVGQYSLMTRLVITPMGVITAALALSFWSRAAELARVKHYAKLRSLYLKVIGVLAGAAVVVSIVCLLSPLYLVPVLGSQWAGTEKVLIASLPLVIGHILFSSTNHLVVLEKQRVQLVADVGRAGLMLIVFFVARAQQLDFVTTVFFLSLSSLTGHVTLFLSHLVVYRQLNRQADH